MLRPAIDHRVVGLEAALGQVDGLAKPSLAVFGADAKVQSCGAVRHENPLSSNTAKQGDFTICSNRNRSKVLTDSRNPHIHW